MTTLPILWSFRRCPYAMRARLAIHLTGNTVELREILLRDKPAAFLAASRKATVPVLQTAETVIEESRDVMRWAIAQADPASLGEMSPEGEEIIDMNDGPFKAALDHTKYHVRYPNRTMEDDRATAAQILMEWNARLATGPHILGERLSLADIAILPFVRQFANIDRSWFDAQDWPHLIRWLNAFLDSAPFLHVMHKYPPWQPGQSPVVFG